MTTETEEATPKAAWVDRVRPARKRRELPDRGNGSVGGLYLIVQPSGRKSWAVRYRFRSKTRKLTLGNYPVISLAKARAKAAEALALRYEGTDPAATREDDEQPASFETVAREFITRYCKKNRTWTETARIIGLRPSKKGDDLVVIKDGLVDRWRKQR